MKEFECKVTEAYVSTMKLKLKQYIFACETGIALQPKLIWLAARSIFQMDLMLIMTDSCYVLLKIKCPESKKHLKPFDLT